jgi:DNA repair exonuclease SbcCD nuclease subunit
MGYQQQRGYPEMLSKILAALRECLLADSGVDFVLHGGDMIDAASDDNILSAAESFKMPVPVYVCLGNHDLTVSTALERWMDLAPGFFLNGSPEYTIKAEHCIVHVVPNHWHDLPYHWENVQNVHFSEDQIEHLVKNLSIMPHLPHIILTHSPVFGLPVEQTGFSEPFHPPNASFTDTITDLAAKHGNIQCVLGAHNHMNMRVRSEGVEFLTVSSLVETPFEFKLFDVAPDSITMSTVDLAKSLNFDGEYDVTRNFVQGRAIDRSFSTRCHRYFR